MASLSHHLWVVPTQESIFLGLRNQSSSLCPKHILMDLMFGLKHEDLVPKMRSTCVLERGLSSFDMKAMPY